MEKCGIRVHEPMSLWFPWVIAEGGKHKLCGLQGTYSTISSMGNCLQNACSYEICGICDYITFWPIRWIKRDIVNYNPCLYSFTPIDMSALIPNYVYSIYHGSNFCNKLHYGNQFIIALLPTEHVQQKQMHFALLPFLLVAEVVDTGSNPVSDNWNKNLFSLFLHFTSMTL